MGAVVVSVLLGYGAMFWGDVCSMYRGTGVVSEQCAHLTL
jgi:hypothetical protein